jgi:ribosome silencing factor RsfS/YbeB/iojap
MPGNGYRHRYGVTLKETTSTRNKGDDKDNLMDKDNQLAEAIEAALDKNAQDLVWLDLTGVCSFTDNFLVCTGTSSRHNQTIADSVEEKLKKQGVRALHIEGRVRRRILMDYWTSSSIFSQRGHAVLRS